MGWREGAGLKPAPDFKELSAFYPHLGQNTESFSPAAVSVSGQNKGLPQLQVHAAASKPPSLEETDESFFLQGPRTVAWAGKRTLQREPYVPRTSPEEDSKQAVCLDKALLKTLQKFMYKTTFPPPYQDVSHPPGTKQVPGACCQLGDTQRVLRILQKYQIHVVQSWAASALAPLGLKETK